MHDANNTQADVDRLVALFDPTIWEATLSVICERDETMTVAHRRQRELTEGVHDQDADRRLFDQDVRPGRTG